MTTRLCVQVYEDRQLVWSEELDGPVEIGRQDRGEPPPFTRVARKGRSRLVLARGEEDDVGRCHAQVDPLPGGRARLTNKSPTQALRLLDGSAVLPGMACDLELPLVLSLGRRSVSVQAAPSRPAPPQPSRLPASPGPAGVDGKALVPWLPAALDVLQAADPADFFDRAAEAAVAVADFDSCQLLLRREGEWRPQALRLAPAGLPGPHRPGGPVLAKVLQEKRTCWEVPAGDGHNGPAQAQAVVATPILDRNGAVLGALYGERRCPRPAAGALTEVEAVLLELLARGVAAGLARLEQEQAAREERVRFEQFLSPELARQLARQPDLLRCRDAEVSILFCDVRDFSRLTERLGPARTVEWINDVLDELSECVLAEGGVLVSYIGDELLAMWGAPEAQPDHARRACRAALAMLGRLPALNQRWQATLGEPLELGIGINSGTARVGNTGSRYKFNFGAAGTTVNLASRVRGATKHLKCRLLLTGATREHLDAGFAPRRLGRFQVVHIDQAVDLYELAPADRPNWAEARARYERALDLFERRQFAAAAGALGACRGQADDGPALVLLHRAVQSLLDGAPPTHPVWVLADK
jgi:adenylate cyclase